MSEKEFCVDCGYPGYVSLGWAKGRFEAAGGAKMPYRNMFVLSPVSEYQSEDYEACGMKSALPPHLHRQQHGRPQHTQPPALRHGLLRQLQL